MPKFVSTQQLMKGDTVFFYSSETTEGYTWGTIEKIESDTELLVSVEGIHSACVNVRDIAVVFR